MLKYIEKVFYIGKRKKKHYTSGKKKNYENKFC